jgi:replicative DNA helicase
MVENLPTSPLPEKLPPQSIEAEKALLGCLMLDKNAILKVVDFLEPQDFYKGAHQEIYKACKELFEKGEPIDILSLSERLKEKGKIDEVGGMTYLTELINTVPTAAHVSHYAKIVQKKRILRELINVSEEIIGLAYKEEEDPEKILDEAEKRIFAIASRGLPRNLVSVKDCLEDAFERIDLLSKQGKGLRGIPTGFSDLDNLLAGLQNSDLIILAARPSIGKSALAACIAANVAVYYKLPVGIFSLEMSRDQIVDRLISIISGVDLWRIRTGKLSSEGEENDFVKIRNALSILAEAPIYIDDTGALNIFQIKAMARRLQAEKGLSLLIVDYLQLMEPINPNASPVQQVSENSRALKSLAKELNIPVLAVSQLSRAVEQRSPPIPKLSDLRQSGTIEQDADVVLFIYREEYYKPDTPRKGIADIIVAKHRNGPVGRVELYFDARTVSFKNLEKEFFEEF